MPIKCTKDYELFTLRDDNRDRIIWSHVDKLARSIQSKNMLDLKPISVNSKLEILDGQHRFLAAKKLGVPIYYIVDTQLQVKDMILLNISKNWNMMDYLNYYSKNGFEHYVNFSKFLEKNEMSLKIALTISVGREKEKKEDFKNGKFEFSESRFCDKISEIKSSMDILFRENPSYKQHYKSARFWSALLKIVTHMDVDLKKWEDNLIKLAHKVTPKSSGKDYLKILQHIYNWHNQNKINFCSDFEELVFN